MSYLHHEGIRDRRINSLLKPGRLAGALHRGFELSWVVHIRLMLISFHSRTLSRAIEPV